MTKRDYCLCENKGADQLCSNCEADQRLCFHYTDSTIPLLVRFEISSFWSSSETVQVGSCQTWSETPMTGFLMSRLSLLCHSCTKYIVAQKRYGKPRKSWDEVLLDDRMKLGMDTAEKCSEWRGQLRRRLVKQAQPSIEDNGL